MRGEDRRGRMEESSGLAGPRDRLLPKVPACNKIITRTWITDAAPPSQGAIAAAAASLLRNFVGEFFPHPQHGGSRVDREFVRREAIDCLR